LIGFDIDLYITKNYNRSIFISSRTKVSSPKVSLFLIENETHYISKPLSWSYTQYDIDVNDIFGRFGKNDRPTGKYMMNISWGNKIPIFNYWNVSQKWNYNFTVKEVYCIALFEYHTLQSSYKRSLFKLLSASIIMRSSKY